MREPGYDEERHVLTTRCRHEQQVWRQQPMQRPACRRGMEQEYEQKKTRIYSVFGRHRHTCAGKRSEDETVSRTETVEGPLP